MTEAIAFLVVFVLGMVVNEFHNMMRRADARKLEALRGDKVHVYVTGPDGLEDVLKNTGAPTLPAKFAQDFKNNGHARAKRVNGRWD